MSTEISLEYGDVLKAYQTKSGELLTQLITAEARLNASATLIMSLKERITQLEKENEKLQKSSTKAKKSSPETDTVVDYN
jgi:CII-binding regulator of phage lambda lysogenization HflD